MKAKYYAGQGCTCYARAGCYCSCGVDWTDPKIYEQANRITELEQQRDELLLAAKAVLTDMRRRAKMAGDVDADGIIVLPIGCGVLFKMEQAIAKAEVTK